MLELLYDIGRCRFAVHNSIFGIYIERSNGSWCVIASPGGGPVRGGTLYDCVCYCAEGVR